MTPDQIEKTMRFILEHQAQLTASVQKHDEAIAALERHAARHDHQIQEVTNLIGRLAVAETHLAEGANRFEERMNALREVQKETAERLNALIIIVERYISGRDGGARSGQ